jgi:hypothetical protein
LESDEGEALKRIAIIGTALAVLVGAAAAYAAYNNYAGTTTRISKGVGSKKKPLALSMIQTLKVSAPSGERAAPLTNIKTMLYGVKLDAGKLPVCTDAKILQDKASPTGACPKGSLIATGTVKALLGPGSDNSASKGTPCNPHLNVFNGGPKTEVFYFWTKTASDCGGLTTGSTAPYDGHISYRNGSVVVNIPLPTDISTKVAGQPNFFSSLIGEVLSYPKKVNGKGFMAGIGCKKQTRPWSVTFTAHTYAGGTEKETVTGKTHC